MYSEILVPGVDGTSGEKDISNHVSFNGELQTTYLLTYVITVEWNRKWSAIVRPVRTVGPVLANIFIKRSVTSVAKGCFGRDVSVAGSRNVTSLSLGSPTVSVRRLIPLLLCINRFLPSHIEN